MKETSNYICEQPTMVHLQPRKPYMIIIRRQKKYKYHGRLIKDAEIIL
jgi:hypothetical protein